MVQINAASSLEKNECFKGVINRLVSFINVLAKKKKNHSVVLLLQSLHQISVFKSCRNAYHAIWQ